MATFYLSGLKTKDDLKKIVIERWNYQPTFYPFPTTDFKEETLSKIKNAEIISEYLGFQILFIELVSKEKPADIERFLKRTEREIITQIPKDKRDDMLYVFSFSDGNWWHFVAVDSFGVKTKLKRFIIDPENRNKLRTPCQQLDELKINPHKDITLQEIKRKYENAFSVDLLTDDFYKNYKENIFDKLRDYLSRQKKDIKEPIRNAHLYAHQFLNRIMFLYFVQKKGCFEQDKEFMRTFWNAYCDNYEGENKFHSLWLNVLFFESLSQPSYLFKRKACFDKRKDTAVFNQILKNAPYLNGGLFNENDLDGIEYQIDDDYFKDIYNFFESYNFTIQESTPLEQDIAIDPEMLGNIYEMMVNVTEQEDERHQAGIFYTPKREIELMLRRSLVEFLFNKTKIDKDKLYQFVFREKEEQIVPSFSCDENNKILKELDNIKIVDPACGSGHYLVVATQILYELKEHLYSQRKETIDRFNEKKKIIENSIFGVDVKEWATQIAKLRLWLGLFVDADEERLKYQIEPLLPSLSFKIRVGDSLVQSIGKNLVPLRRLKAPTSQLKERIKQLAQHKNLAYQNKYNDKKVIMEERKVLSDILLYSKIKIQQEIHNLSVSMGRQEIQYDMFKKVSPEQRDFFVEQQKKKMEGLQNELRQVESFLEEIRKLEEPPLIWDIGFSDIFSGGNGKNGFDIVIANPPYVRQELIADPVKQRSQGEDKREYKSKLLEQTLKDWNDFKGRLIKIDKKADLYVYFYLKGLQLLNQDGVFCYISSNSWLDVGYGSALQEILLKRVPILAIYDNQAKRSFKHADVNTIIIVLGAPKVKDWQDDLKENTIKFISFKKSFEEVFYTEVFTEIEKIANLRKETDLFRIRPINQFQLYLEGLEEEKGEKLDFAKEYKGVYIGNKWGVKYLRIPDIFFKIFELCKEKLVKLEDIANVRRGITPGIKDFFYINDIKISEWEMEEEFITPIITSTHEINSLIVDSKLVKNKLFLCSKTKQALKASKKYGALTYIEWGESQRTKKGGSQTKEGILFPKVSTVLARPLWYSIPDQEPGDFLIPRLVRERYFIAMNEPQSLIGDMFFHGRFKKRDHLLLSCAVLNSTLTFFFLEIFGRINIGGRLYFDGNIIKPLLVPCIDKISSEKEDKIVDAFLKVAKRQILRITEELKMEDRHKLDKLVLSSIGIEDMSILNEIYVWIEEAVMHRLGKEKSL